VSAEEDGDDADVEKVKNLVLEVIKKPSCLILLVVSAESRLVYLLIGLYLTYIPAETQNQVGRHLAKQADPSGNRTIRTLLSQFKLPPTVAQFPKFQGY
jgi:hypothetical protein